MRKRKPLHRTEALAELGQSISGLRDILAQLWEAILNVEAVDAGRAPDAEQHSAGMTHLVAVCADWQERMVGVRDLFTAWTLAVERHQHEATSGKELLRGLADEEEK